MSDKKKPINPHTYKFDTLSLHAGYMPEKNSGSRQVPIYQTTSYMFEDQNGIFSSIFASPIIKNNIYV